MRTLPALEPLEIHAGLVLGRRRSTHGPDQPPRHASTPRAVLEELLLPALACAPCLVAFSGGRDSSAILATATQVARRHGLPDPVPATMRYEAHARTDEAEWQEMTVRHLDLRDWQILSLHEELDALGPTARRILRQHGLYWPPNGHSLVPLLEAAAGGALITGNGGDEALSPWIYRRIRLIRRGRLRPARYELKFVALSLLPRPVRARAWRSRRPLSVPWLRPEAERAAQKLWASKLAHQLRTWGEALEQELLNSRYLELSLPLFHALARDAGAQLHQPFLDARFIHALVEHGPRESHASRTAAMESYFGDVLPKELLDRSTKARFTEVFWGPEARAFASEWDGTGLDAALIDPDELRRQWARPVPDYRSLTPLQAAWLASTTPSDPR